MKTKFTILAFLLISMAGIAQEKIHQVQELTAINYGDGRLLFRLNNEDQTPLQGENRIIDGYRSEYILATFKDGMYEGPYKHYRNNVLVEESTYSEGLKTGTQKKYDFQSLITSSGEFTQGKLNGVYTTYYQDGKIDTEQQFNMGTEHGFCHAYDRETGEITQKSYYKDGIADSIWIQHISSNPCDYLEHRQFKDGKQIGEHTRIAANGTYLLKGAYTNGKKDGEWLRKEEDGRLRDLITYDLGIKNGPYKNYFENGKLKEEGVYENDQIVKSVKYNEKGKRIKE